MNNRLKNYGLWMSIAALVFLLMQDFGFGIDMGRYEIYVNVISAILIGLGIVNNPTTDNRGFKDDQIQG